MSRLENDNFLYENWLKRMDFNNEQIQFIMNQRQEYLNLKRDKYFSYDSYERDLWYTMNRSGLFEKDKANKSDITNWNPTHTRLFITEI